ncbi:MAG TPA: hypothetical protein VFP12_11865 [Allosphingosinicella sp.]|nr:hypothetical protein [Allosphingosinicella sp.]
MLLEDHRRRVARLRRGERKVTDLHSLFSDLRMHQPGRASVQEIGHFAAHRHERDAGISLARANDIQTSAKLWHRQFEGAKPNAEHLREAGRANLRIMPEERIKESLGISRQTAEQSFNKAIRKFEAGRPLKEREFQVLKVFGLSMMWQFAFSDKALWSDFVDLLLEEGSLAKEDRRSFEAVSPFVSLYALNIMHGARLKMTDGKMAQLRLAVSEESGLLRIKAEIPVSDTPKPITTSVPMFETTLMAGEHCDPKLLTIIDEPIPAEIDGDKLVALA